MVGSGFLYVIIFIIFLWLTLTHKLENLKYKKLLLWLGIISMPLVFLTTEAGWIVVEVGRQPWIVQDLMTTSAAVTNITTASVKLTFWIFAVIFTALLIAEINIMVKAIKKGPEKTKED